jgi:hypothetical protein
MAFIAFFMAFFGASAAWVAFIASSSAQPLVAASGAVWCTAEASEVEQARGPRSHPNPPRATLATTATASPAKYATNSDLGLAPLLSGTKGLGQLAVEAEAALC